MPPRILNRGPVGVAIVAWKVWQRLPPEARRSVVRAARSHGVRAARAHGPRIASLLAKRALARRRV
jgi:hypothetical protein